MARTYSVHGLESIPKVGPEDNLPELIYRSAQKENIGLREGDLVVLSSKVAAKAQGRFVDLKKIVPSHKARAISRITGKDPRRVEVILRESAGIAGYISTRRLKKNPELVRRFCGSLEAADLLEKAEALLLVRMHDGSLASDAGTDLSNMAGEEHLCLLPASPRATAAEMRLQLEKRAGCRLGLLLTDSEVRLMRYGTAEVALAWSGIKPLSDLFGAPDMYGRPKFGGVDALADQAANAAALLMGQNDEKIPAVIIRGLSRLLASQEKPDEQLAVPLRYQARFVGAAALSALKLRLGTVLRYYW